MGRYKAFAFSLSAFCCPALLSLSCRFLLEESLPFLFFISSLLDSHLTRSATSRTLLVGNNADIFMYLPKGENFAAGNFFSAMSSWCCSSSLHFVNSMALLLVLLCLVLCLVLV